MMIDLTGIRFGRLIVSERYGLTEKGEVIWQCSCDCGNTCHVASIYLRDGRTSSCGCLRRELRSRLNTTHGRSTTPTYFSWNGMWNRCRNKKHRYYNNYGDRGIKVCRRWEKFENFYKDMGERPKGTTLDRKNNSKGYSKSNCRWVSRLGQSNNRRNNHKITFKGRTRTIAEWSREIGIDYGTLWTRIKYKWSVERALTEPVNKT